VDQPQSPENLPKYIAEGVPKQDDTTLRELQSWIDEIIEYRNDISPEEIEVSNDESLEAVDDTGETNDGDQESALREGWLLHVSPWDISIRGSS